MPSAFPDGISPDGRGETQPASTSTSSATAAKPQNEQERISQWAHKYRGATVEDLDPPPAMSVYPSTPVSGALMGAYERDYTHLTVTSPEDRALLGYLNIPRLKELLQSGSVAEADTVDKAMQRFRRKKGVYKTITMDTPLEELEDFFRGGGAGEGGKQEFAVVTDERRRFVLGVATRGDLEEFVKRRPG